MTTSQILARKLSEPPPRVSSLRSSVNAHMDEVIGRALETVPADRYPSVAAFSKALVEPDGALHTQKALSFTDRVTERERLWILAEIENWKGNFEGAIDSYNIYLTRYPDDLDGWFRLGYAQMREGRHADAAQAFSSVVAMDPENAGGFINVATCQVLLNRREEAVEDYLRAFDLNPAWLTSGNLNHEFGFNYVVLGRLEEAEATFRKMLEGNDDQRALGNRSLALMRMYLGRYAEARAHLREAAFLHQTLGSSLSEMRNRLYLATALFATDSVDAASDQLAAAVYLADAATAAPSWLANIGKLQARKGFVEEAEVTLQKALQRLDESIQDDRAAVALLRGEVAVAGGDPAAGVEELRTAHTLKKNPDYLESLAFGLFRSGDLDQALNLYLSLLGKREIGWEVQEYWLESHIRVGRILEELGEPAKARDYYEALLEIWAEGDSDLVALKVARERLVAMGSGS